MLNIRCITDQSLMVDSYHTEQNVLSSWSYHYHTHACFSILNTDKAKIFCNMIRSPATPCISKTQMFGSL